MTACFSSSLLHLPWAHLHGFIAALEFTRMGSSDKSVGLIVTSKFPVRPTSRLSETMTDPFSSSTASMRSLSARASAPNPQSPQYWMVTVQVLLPEAAIAGRLLLCSASKSHTLRRAARTACSDASVRPLGSDDNQLRYATVRHHYRIERGLHLVRAASRRLQRRGESEYFGQGYGCW
eukprot:TRINITY_DN597_c0_g1_i4.p1 TRINITY_DN597_c0_g1~~TRINITY_DN597_c0_g1_i4.p1  ORF type:complete len:178 (-),score=4.42 TRINITY_DN597_c0_g1_i4:384-917(-)